MGQNVFPQPSLNSNFDPMSYPTSLNRESSIAVVANSWYSVLSVTGSGYIDKAVASHQSATAMTSVRITVDGVIVFEGQSATLASYCTGVVQESHVAANGAGTAIYTRAGAGSEQLPTVVQQFPYTGGSTGWCPLSKPIKFNSSLLIELKCNGSISVYYSILGGAK